MSNTKKQAAKPAKNQSIEAQVVGALNKVAALPDAIVLAKDTLDAVLEQAQVLASYMRLGLQVVEAEVDAAKAKKQEEFTTMVAALKEGYDTQAATYAAELQSIKAEVEAAKVTASRELENTLYTLKVAQERESLETVQSVARMYRKTLVDNNELAELQSKADAVDTAVEAAKEAVRKELVRDSAIALNSLKADKNAEIGLLTQRAENAEKVAADLKHELAYLREQLAKVPEQIAKAVEAARAAVNVNNDTSGRK